MKKFTATILIIAMILSLGLNIFLFKPKRAKAFLGIGDITIDIVNQIKDWIVDTLPKTVARHMMVRLQQEIARWAQGGFSDENKPFAMISWKEELKMARDIASARFVQDFKLTPLCAPIKVSLNTLLGLGLSPYYRVPYTQYAACTLETVIDNIEEFYKNPSIGLYGWDTWTALTQPQNNIYGSFLIATQRMAELESEEIAEKEKEIETGQGYKSETICTQDDRIACVTDCERTYGAETTDANECIKGCEKSSIGVCLQEQVKTLGSEIKASIDKTIGSDIDWLISADEITEMLGLIFSGVFNKLIHGAGLALKPFYQPTDTITKNQLEYGYHSSYQKSLTPQDLKNLRTDILTNILSSIKRINVNSYECDSDYQLKGEVFSEIVLEILDQESQHLYTAIDGVNLKPDFEVLDTALAVENNIAIYGITWDDIPFNRYPPKCAEIGKMKCAEIFNNLPYELKVKNINLECATGCLEQINNYRTKGASDEEAISKAVNDGKCSNSQIGRACLNGANLINKTENRCNECLKNAQAYCQKGTESLERENCLELYCSNYEDISASIISARDFYNRCRKVELRNSCEVCLMEYFMPATYCEQTYDYINRAFVKYPALVYENTWYGMFNKFADCAEQTQGVIPYGLTCRILPDFQFSSGATCKTRCNVTDDELKDITDFEPSDADCNPREWGAGAKHPAGLYGDYLVTKKAKCCPALTGHEPEMYKKCRGITSDVVGQTCTYALPVEEEPWCYCDNGERPLGWAKVKPYPEYTDPVDIRYCADFSFESPEEEIRIYTDATPGGGVIYVARESCNDPDIDDQIADGPDGEICSFETPRIAPGAGMQEYYCDLSGESGEIHGGVYNNEVDDDYSTTAHMCAPCDSGDPDYPYYGTDYDQCTGKVK